MSTTDQYQELFDAALSSVPVRVAPATLVLHQRLHRRRLRTRFSATGVGALAVAVGAAALLTSIGSNPASAVTLYPGAPGAVVRAQLTADQRVLGARLRAVGYPNAIVTVNHGALVVENGPKDLAGPSSFLTASPELLVRAVVCYAGAQSGTPTSDPLPSTCSGPQYAAPVATSFGGSSGFTTPATLPDPVLSAYTTTTPSQDAASPNAFALLPLLHNFSSGRVRRYLVGPTLLTLSSKVASATVVKAPITGGWMVKVRLNRSDSRLWDRVAARYFHAQLAVDLNGVIVEAPLIEPASTTFSSFDGQMVLVATTKSEDYDLAAALSTGPLAVPLVAHRHQGSELANPAVVAASQRLRSVLAKNFPEQFAGVTLGNDDATIDVFVTGSDARLIGTVRRLAPRSSVHFVTVINTWRSLLAVHHELEASLSDLRTDGIDIADFSPDPATNRESIEVVDLTPRQTRILDLKFGANNISVRGITEGQAPVPGATTW